jgi:protein DGCR14
VRDFYPDIPKLHAQAEYLKAVEKNDVVKLRELHIKYGPKRSSTATPRNICKWDIIVSWLYTYFDSIIPTN